MRRGKYATYNLRYFILYLYYYNSNARLNHANLKSTKVIIKNNIKANLINWVKSTLPNHCQFFPEEAALLKNSVRQMFQM